MYYLNFLYIFLYNVGYSFAYSNQSHFCSIGFGFSLLWIYFDIFFSSVIDFRHWGILNTLLYQIKLFFLTANGGCYILLHSFWLLLDCKDGFHDQITIFSSINKIILLCKGVLEADKLSEIA